MSLATTTSRISYATDGVSTVFSYPYYFLVASDLVVIKRLNISPFTETTLVLNTDYTVSGAGVQAGGSVTTAPVIVTGYTLSIYRNPPQTQGLVLVENDPAPADSQEKAFDKLTMIVQTLSDLDARSVKLSPGYPANAFDLTLPPNLAPNTVFIVNPGGTGLSSGPTAGDIAAAQANAAAALVSETNAAASASAASGSATSASASASAAAAAVQSAFFRDVVYLTNANSPKNLVVGDNGKLFVCDTSGGAIVINLPTISGITTPFNSAIKVSNSTNSVTINPGGSDTIDKSASAKVLVDLNETALLVADTDLAPDDWTSIVIDSATTLTIRTVTSNDTISANDDVILVNTAGGDVTLGTAASSASPKKRKTIKKISLDANKVIIDPNGAETIDGETTVTLRAARESITIIPDGSNWYAQGWYESARFFIVRSEQAMGVNEPATPGGSWLTRTLNTSISGANWASLAANQITLQPGYYIVRAKAVANSVDTNQTRFYNITDSSVAILGTSEFVANTIAGGVSSFIIGRVVISATKVFELQHRVATANPTNGFGVDNGFGTNVYAQVEIERISPRSS